MMKTFSFLAAAMLFVSSLTAQTKETREVSGFTSLKVGSAIRVVLTMGDKESLVFEAKDEVLKKLKAEVKNGVLHLYSAPT
jgi:hypothetical protein